MSDRPPADRDLDARLDAAAEAAAAAAPPLSDAVRARIAAVLRPVPVATREAS
ncbi:hypothetical protein SAMN05660657_05072 [Geodermatophilus amargosae]|uniref:Uncharacterized protein n=1 Tax=Geodermatophilus amargosae TaxID=1296565 RepID=A0A1I7CZA1_9ACTN|nr:hypothetical protein [Geodermatophilus amargosae]SFU04742.1 hypothetical protein SAMN05660657_05072 [Geodermatophilus amargosae]